MKVRLNTKPAKSKKAKNAKIKINGMLPSLKLNFLNVIILLVYGTILGLVLPIIMNYAPESILNAFDKQMSGTLYSTEILLALAVLIFASVCATKLTLIDVDRWYKTRKATKKQLEKIRYRCATIPYFSFFIGLILITLVPILVMFGLENTFPIMLIKLIVLLFGLMLFVNVNTFAITKKILDEILTETYSEDLKILPRQVVGKRLFMLISSIMLSIGLLMSYSGYSAAYREKGNTLFVAYYQELRDVFNENKIYTVDEIEKDFKKIDEFDSIRSKFILWPNDGVTIVEGKDISYFVKEYTKQISDKYNGRIFEEYGEDAQGVVIKLKTEQGNCYAGIVYEVSTLGVQKMLILNSVIFIITIIIMIWTIVSSIQKDLQKVVEGFKNVSSQKSKAKIIPVICNDSIGDLVQEFNRIQNLNENQITTIKDNQNTIIEKERLASLGQMVGGIAHNMKTPIFSISGGLEGLNDLIKEFDESVEDSRVTNEDMHAIAKDMREWTKKIKGHTAYMSELITAVKGQAVNFGEEPGVDFTVEELLARVRVLMQHEVKQTLTELEINNRVPDEVIIHGGINNLVQVINNLVSNAIQCYENEDDKKIVELAARLDKNTNMVIISVQDYGPGITEEVQEKMFNEMFTTKGKNGTGLGLFMSQSNIRAYFKGDLTYQTKVGEGTTFYIKIPAK